MTFPLRLVGLRSLLVEQRVDVGIAAIDVATAKHLTDKYGKYDPVIEYLAKQKDHWMAFPARTRPPT
jgi:hypothetical protein